MALAFSDLLPLGLVLRGQDSVRIFSFTTEILVSPNDALAKFLRQKLCISHFPRACCVPSPFLPSVFTCPDKFRWGTYAKARHYFSEITSQESVRRDLVFGIAKEMGNSPGEVGRDGMGMQHAWKRELHVHPYFGLTFLMENTLSGSQAQMEKLY